MIEPGVSSKSAESRFNNSQTRAQQASMPHNLAAQQSLRPKHKRKRFGGPPVGRSQQVQMPTNPRRNQPVEVPTGGPQLPPEQTEGFDPGVFHDDLLDKIVGTVRTEEFLNSPRTKDAMTTVMVKNYFNATNPNAIPDNRSLFQKVVSRLGMVE